MIIHIVALTIAILVLHERTYFTYRPLWGCLCHSSASTKSSQKLTCDNATIESRVGTGGGGAAAGPTVVVSEAEDGGEMDEDVRMERADVDKVVETLGLPNVCSKYF